MARKTRISLPNIPQHIIKKGINQEKVFHSQEDYEVFFEIMQEYSKKLYITIYSYILMEEYFELLINSHISDNISKFMQTLGRQYVLYYNKKYGRSGTIWEGRYKTSLVENKRYLSKVISYFDYLATKNNLINSICSNLKELKQVNISKEDINFIEKSLQSETITGSDEFIQGIENIVGKSLILKKRGRPKSNEIKGSKMYKKLELLSKEKHKDLKIGKLNNLLFLKDIPSFPIITSEAELVASSFPIVFTADESPSIVAINSLGGENLAMNHEGKWLTSYIPAVYRKYPFTYVSNKDNPEERAVAIDVEAPHLSREFGIELFDENSNQTKFLKDTIQFLTSYEQDAMKSRMIAKIVLDAGILEERELSIGEGEEKRVLAKGFKVVDIDKLNALDDATLASWVRNGTIAFINLHIKSLDNMQNLMNLLFQKNN